MAFKFYGIRFLCLSIFFWRCCRNHFHLTHVTLCRVISDWCWAKVKSFDAVLDDKRFLKERKEEPRGGEGLREKERKEKVINIFAVSQVAKVKKRPRGHKRESQGDRLAWDGPSELVYQNFCAMNLNPFSGFKSLWLEIWNSFRSFWTRTMFEPAF